MSYQNPILQGFHADPSICRVGDLYYLVNSSFEYFPGIPIYRSRDLVNWEQVGNAVSWNNAISLEGVKESGGIWAPTIRFSEGMFFVTAAIENYGNFIVHAKDPCGTWSEPVWVDIGGIDPSLFFEQGKAYYCTTDRLGGEKDGICLGVIDPFTGKVLEPFRTIWHGTGGGWLESPHVYHIGDWYYILTAEGGTFLTHMVTIGRSRTIYGPYESYQKNPILTNSRDTSWEVLCTGHGDIMQDCFGRWWMVHLSTRLARRTMSHLGRETFLTPFTWKEEWPEFKEGKARLIEDIEMDCQQKNKTCMKDDFSDTVWKTWWQFIRNPDMSKYERGNNRLVLKPSLGSIDKNSSGTFTYVCMAQPGFECMAEVSMEFNPEQDTEEAGILLYHTHSFFYSFGLRNTEGNRMLFLRKHAEDFDDISYITIVEQRLVTMHIIADREKYIFCIEDNAGWREVARASTRFLSNEVIGRSFTGTMLGLYAVSEKVTEATAVFHEYQVREYES